MLGSYGSFGIRAVSQDVWRPVILTPWGREIKKQNSRKKT
jgi:hypothetical protein